MRDALGISFRDPVIFEFVGCVHSTTGSSLLLRSSEGADDDDPNSRNVFLRAFPLFAPLLLPNDPRSLKTDAQQAKRQARPAREKASLNAWEKSRR